MTMNQANSPFQQLLNQQTQLLDNWMDFSKKVGENFVNQGAPASGEAANNDEAGDNNGPTELFESWFKQQQEMANSIFGMYRKNPTSNMFLFTPEQMKSQFEMYTNWFQQYQKLMNNAGIENPMMTFSEQVGQIGQQIDQFTKLFTEVSTIWEPFVKLVQQGSSVEKIMNEWMKPEAYKKMFDNMMGALNMDTAWQQAAQLQDSYIQYMEQFQEGNFEGLSESMGMKPWFDMMHKVNEQVAQNLAPFSQSLTRSRESEILRLMQEIGFSISEYNLKMAELQTNYYQTSYNALSNSVQQAVSNFQENPESLSYENFFKNYLDQLENALTAAFETATYGQLQNGVAKAGAQLKNNMDRLVELSFAGTPFLMRSQGEDLAAEIQSLKRKVRSLEKQLKEAQATSKTPPAKSTRSKGSTAKR